MFHAFHFSRVLVLVAPQLRQLRVQFAILIPQRKSFDVRKLLRAIGARQTYSLEYLRGEFRIFASGGSIDRSFDLSISLPRGYGNDISSPVVVSRPKSRRFRQRSDHQTVLIVRPLSLSFHY
jgi:hypothetical protein